MSLPSDPLADSDDASTTELTSGARRPTRERGVMRFNALVAATERLLNRHDPDEVGLYQIAEEADVPPASVYHFFPTKGAAFLALAEHYIQGFQNLNEPPVDAASLRSWQDLMALEHARAVSYYNEHIPALKIFLSGHPNWEIRQADRSLMAEIAKTSFDYYDNLFHMPYVANAERMFLISVGIADAIWAISFARHRKISSDYAADALTACIAFCRTYLPERVEPRAKVREAAARGESIPLT
jgi:AcrR family transcriptional regulator